jgi:hypothetical protein
LSRVDVFSFAIGGSFAMNNNLKTKLLEATVVLVPWTAAIVAIKLDALAFAVFLLMLALFATRECLTDWFIS